jgi:hypothetical protein
MDHIHRLNLKNDMFYIGINNSHSKFFALEIDWEFEEGDGSINLSRIYSGYSRSCNHDSPN